MLDSRMPRRLLDGRLGSVELVLSNLRDGCSAADSCHHRSHLGRRRGMPCHHRRSGMRDVCVPRRLLRDSMGCVGNLHFALLVGKRYTLALRKRGGVRRRSAMPTAVEQRCLLGGCVHGLQCERVERLECLFGGV